MPHLNESDFNLAQIFLNRASKFGVHAALTYKDKVTRQFHSLTWADWKSSVEKTFYVLKSFGIKAGDRVGILSENRPEWTYADLAALALGAIVVPIYPTLTAKEISYILVHSGVNLLFVSSAVQVQKLGAEAACDLSRVKKIITFDQVTGIILRQGIECLGSLISKAPVDPLGFEASANSVSAASVATIIYTSGTTGAPKGVMLTHSNFVQNYIGAREKIKISERDVALSFLPLSHVFERLAGYYFMAFHGARIAYAESMQTVPDDIQAIRPTVCAAVPRFYEKIHAKIIEKVAAAPSNLKRLFHWAVSVGRETVQLQAMNQKPSLMLRIQYAIAKILVFKKIKRQLGGRIRFFISGGAPLNKELAEFFGAAGVLILEGYGLTETSPVITVNTEKEHRFGTVGKVLPNVEVKITEEGEIATRGPCVMKGYYENPEATAEVIPDGWFRTGDIGEFTSDGYLKITDRKKDIIVTSGGKKVPPQNIEGALLCDPAFSQVIVLGDKKNYLVALIVPNRTELLKFAEVHELAGTVWQDLLKHAAVYGWYREKIDKITEDFASYEKIKYFALLPEELSMENGDLTPTLKIKRKVVMEKYAEVLEGLYKLGEGYQR